MSNGARPSAVEMVLAARLSNVSVVWPTGSTVHADAMTVHVPRNPAERRPSNFSVAAARPMPLAPLVVGQGKAIHPKDFSSRAQCLKACKPPPGMPPGTGICTKWACLCFECRHNPYKTCQRCYGLPPNCGDRSMERGKRCVDDSATWSYRATLAKEGCCSTVTDKNGPTTTLEVAKVDTWRELV